MINKITLKPIGNIDELILESLKGRLKETFGCEVKVEPQIYDLALAYNPKRGQHLAETILPNIGTSGKGELALSLVDVDLYTPGLNFIFGEADISLGRAIISLWRLRQERYGLPPDEGLFRERAVKEAIHELGHLCGLRHCPNPNCVMYFSNTLLDTDRKQASFCHKCREEI